MNPLFKSENICYNRHMTETEGGGVLPRPQRNRKICRQPQYAAFIPVGKDSTDTVFLTLDEYEVLRWVDLERQTHEQTARQMDISRTTVTEIYESARSKLTDSIVNGKRLLIAGGNYRFCDGDPRYGCTRNCEKRFHHPLFMGEK